MKNILTATIVWLFSYLVVFALTTAIPYFTIPMHWDVLHWLFDLIPSLALMVVIAIDMRNHNQFDIPALVITFFIGLPGALLYYLIPRRKMYLYGAILSFLPLLQMMELFHIFYIHISNNIGFLGILMKFFVLILLTMDRSCALSTRQLVWLWLIGIHSPTSSILLYYIFNDEQASPATLNKYLVPSAVVSILWIVSSILFYFLDEIYFAANFALFMSILTVLFGIYVFIVMLCDPRVKSVSQYGWYAVAAIFTPFLYFPAVRYLPKKDE